VGTTGPCDRHHPWELDDAYPRRINGLAPHSAPPLLPSEDHSDAFDRGDPNPPPLSGSRSRALPGLYTFNRVFDSHRHQYKVGTLNPKTDEEGNYLEAPCPEGHTAGS